jgi:hypothetical protein
MATTKTIKQQTTKHGSRRNGGDGDCDGDGDGDRNIEGHSGQCQGRQRQHVNRGNSDGHGGDGCRFLGAANLIEVRKANRQIKNVFHCTCTEYYI